MKFSIVTPARNMEHFIKETALSILTQAGDFDLEYIIVDGHSTDTTKSIVFDLKEKIESNQIKIQCRGISIKIIDQTTKGMYGAINEGFALATGEIYAWLNADDIYAPNALAKIAKTFETFPEINWLKGITNTINESGLKVKNGFCRVFHQNWLSFGIYGREAYFVEQDSVFWKKELWQKAGPIPENFLYAGDYWLWIQMAKKDQLWSLKEPISNFRKRAGQLSKDTSNYKNEQLKIRPRRPLIGCLIKLFFIPQFYFIDNNFPFKKIFQCLYALFFLNKMPFCYLEYQNGQVAKRKIMNYIVSNAS